MVIAPGQLEESKVALPPDAAPRTPEEWRTRLEKQLAWRAPTLNRYDEYYNGKHSLRFATEKFRKAFGFLFREFADNMCDVVVDSLSERLRIDGIRLGKAQTQGDEAAWAIWQRNSLDAYSEAAHREAFIKCEAYALVWWDEDAPAGAPLAQITIEKPTEMIVATAPGNRRKVRAALKKYLEDNYAYCELYLPDAIYKWVSNTTVSGSISGTIRWVPNETANEPWPISNPLGRVPVVALQNNPRLDEPMSELAQIIPLQDFLNKVLMDAAVASEYGAFRQRWATGIQIPVDPTTNKPIEDMKMMMDRVWTSRDANTKFGDFTATDVTNFVKLIDLIVQHIAVKTRTPPHYFDLNGQFPSGDALKAAEAPLVRKAQQRALHFGEAWEQVMRLAFLVEGDQAKAAIMDSEIIWGDFEIRTVAELADALLKRQMIGVPDEQLWEDAGYTPTQIARFKQMRAEQPLPPPTVRETFTGAAPTEAEQIVPAGQQTQTGG